MANIINPYKTKLVTMRKYRRELVKKRCLNAKRSNFVKGHQNGREAQSFCLMKMLQLVRHKFQVKDKEYSSLYPFILRRK